MALEKRKLPSVSNKSAKVETVESKLCAYCGKRFERTTSHKVWEKRKYCRLLCRQWAGRDKAKGKKITPSNKSKGVDRMK